MYCEKCGTKLEDSASFCTKCGASIKGEVVKTKEKVEVGKDVIISYFKNLQEK